MPVDSTHPEYDSFVHLQMKCRTAYSGEQAVKEKTTEYLPLLDGMSESSPNYLAYLSRAMFYSATRRTVEGLAGIVDRKPPTINIADGFPWEDDIDGNGMTLHGFSTQVVAEAVLIGWQGIFIDVRNGYDYPYPIQYRAEQITNWHYKDGVLVMVMLKESVNEMNDDYSVVAVDQFRELTLDDGVYIVNIYRQKIAGKGEFVHFDSYLPTKRGDVKESIPFVFVSSNGKLENPPLMDMVEVNFHHFKNSADYEHGLHFTGLPTLWIATEASGDDNDIQIGSETAVVLPIGSQVGYAEFTGQGLGSLVTAMESKKTEMASLGARLLQSDKKAAEAAETARINKSGDSNVIATLVTGVERALNQVLSIMSEWQSVSPDSNTIELNRDFVDEGMTAQDLTALVASVQGGTMSLETAVYNHKKKDMLPDDRTVEEEVSAINSASPQLNNDGFDLGDE